MIHLLVIALFVVAGVRDLAPGPAAGRDWALGHPAMVLACGIVPQVLLAAWAWWTSRRCVRELDRGDGGGVARTEWVIGAGRAVSVALHAASVVGVGLLDVVRGWVGDLVLVDELLVTLPAVGVFVAGWWAAEPVDRRLREALIVRRLDDGRAIPEMPARGRWVWSMVRQHLLFAGIPVVMITGWAEAVDLAADRLWRGDPAVRARHPMLPAPAEWVTSAPEWLRDEAFIAWAAPAAQLAGVLVVLALTPLALRVLWDTVPLEDGEIRRRVLALCERQRVRARAILVWRTCGALLNGAVVGLTPGLRYIVLTDALLESLSPEQVEAVAAHEVGHVRHRHMVWLALSMLAPVLLTASLGAAALSRAGGVDPTRGWWGVLVLAASLGVGLVVFGVCSRVFERQADAFAVKHMSGSSRERGALRREEVVLHGEAVRAMSDALRWVSAINGLSPDRWTWRHGSITGRRRALAALAGVPGGVTSADRAAVLVKAGLVAVLVLAGAIVAIDALGA